MAQRAAKMGWKVFGTVTTVVTGIVARKAVTAIWTKATGKNPPSNAAAGSTTWVEAASWALVSGSAYGLARAVAQAKAAQTWRKAIGSLPPGLEEVS